MKKQEIENFNKWHLSEYALFTENPNNKNQIFYVNTLFREFCVLTREEFNLLFKISNSIIEGSIFKKFIEKKIIVNFNELNFLDAKVKKDLYLLNDLQISICPTLNCNFDCLYCFEKHRPGKMSLEIQNKTIDLIKKMALDRKVKRIGVCWFGGEPLLYPDIIEYMSKELISFCDQNDIRYSANIITNGFLLTQEIADMLKSVKVRKYQITIDGIGEVHNYTRHLVNGGGTFDKIVKNLKEVKISGLIDIRNSIYESNLKDKDKVKELVEDIKKISGNNLNYYVGKIFYNENLEGKENQLKILSSQKIEKTVILPNGFKMPEEKYLCTGQRLGCITIDEKGNLYKCRDEQREGHHFGNINTWDSLDPINSAENPDMITCYLNSGFGLEDEECRKCIWVPICRGGGCANQRIFYGKKCIPYKDKPDYFVLNIAQYFLKNKLNK